MRVIAGGRGVNRNGAVGRRRRTSGAGRGSQISRVGSGLLVARAYGSYGSMDRVPEARYGIRWRRDRPKASGGGTCHELASQESYGHSGFTGTLVWADPKHQINYVFLSNRVCPSQDNWKIRDLNIRTEIQRVIYEALNENK